MCEAREEKKKSFENNRPHRPNRPRLALSWLEALQDAASSWEGVGTVETLGDDQPSPPFPTVPNRPAGGSVAYILNRKQILRAPGGV